MKADIETERVVCTTACAYGNSREIGIYALAEAVNDYTAAGGTLPEVSGRVMIPAQCRKSSLNALIKNLEKVCKEQDLKFHSVRQEKSPAVGLPVVYITCAGRRTDCLRGRKSCRPGQDIVLTKWAGMDGMLRILSEREEQLKERFAPGFIKQMKSYKKGLFARMELETAKKMGTAFLLQIKEGGVLAALWELAKEADTGIELDIKKISVLQETIEVCENYRLNPYQLTSAGSFLMVSDDGGALAAAIRQQGTKASLIGQLTDNNDKIIHNGDEIRYIDRPAPDELGKIFCG